MTCVKIDFTKIFVLCTLFDSSYTHFQDCKLTLLWSFSLLYYSIVHRLLDKSALKVFVLFVTFIIFQLIFTAAERLSLSRNYEHFFVFFSSFHSSLICFCCEVGLSHNITTNRLQPLHTRKETMCSSISAFQICLFSAKNSHHPNGIDSKASVYDGRRKSVSTI